MFATASATKTFTALVVMSLVEAGPRARHPARSLLGDDLPLIADDVTVEHLLAHRSGIGDYLDEEADRRHRDYVMPVPVHELATTEQFLPVLDGHETVFPAGERFAYNNGGYVVLALLAERASGVGYHELVRRWSASRRAWSTPRSSAPTSCRDAPRSATCPSTAADERVPPARARHRRRRDLHDGRRPRAFWDSLFAGRIVPSERVAEMVRPHSDWPEESAATGSASTWTRRATASGSRATTQASRSPACTSPRPRSRRP